MVIATRSDTPRFTMFLTAVRRKSCRNRPALPFFQAVRHRTYEVLDPFAPVLASEVREQVRNDRPSLALQRPHPFHLSHKRGFEVGGDVDDAPVVILRGPPVPAESSPTSRSSCRRSSVSEQLRIALPQESARPSPRARRAP